MLRNIVSTSKYVIIGIFLIFFSVFLVIIFTTFFQTSIALTNSYIKDSCIIKQLIVKDVQIDCFYGPVYRVQAPCVLILVDTKYYKNVTFYRNIQEKIFSNSNSDNEDCSYIPTACQNDAAYLKDLLTSSLSILFPPENFQLGCYTDQLKGSNTDALMNIPDVFAYYVGITLVVIGFIIGIVLIIFGYIDQKLSTNKESYINFLIELNRPQKSKKNLAIIQKAADFFNIDIQDVITRNITSEIEKDTELSNSNNNIKMYSKTSSASNSMISLSNGLKYAQNRKSFVRNSNRIEYKPPSAINSGLSRNSSIHSKISVNKNQPRNRFLQVPIFHRQSLPVQPITRNNSSNVRFFVDNDDNYINDDDFKKSELVTSNV